MLRIRRRLTLIIPAVLLAVGAGGCRDRAVPGDGIQPTAEELAVPLLGKITGARPDRHPPPPDRLLDPAELQIPPRGDDADTAGAGWLRDNAVPLRSLVHDRDLSDLAFLDPLLAGKRVVLLGESAHGVSEFDQVRVRLVKYLHEHLGYDVVAFESGLLSCYLADAEIASRPPLDTMRRSIFPIWHCDATLELFRYLAACAGTDRPLVLAGVDYQYSGIGVPAFRARADFWRRIVATVDPAYADEVAAVVGRLTAAAPLGQVDDLPAADRGRYFAAYVRLVGFLEDRLADIRAAWDGAPLAPLFALQAARSDARLLADYRPGRHVWTDRDSCMADNLEFLLDTAYPGRKIIVWAHNGHIRRRGGAVGRYGFRDMGQMFVERHPDDGYAVGLFMGHGFAATNRRDLYRVENPPAGSLGAVLQQAGLRALFVDLSGAPAGPRTAWMDRPLNARTWGFGTAQQVVRDQYDGLIYIDEVQEPLYCDRAVPRRTP